MILLLLACSGLPDPPSALVPLESPQLLRRMSLDLRGTLPTVEELDAVAEDPSLLDALRDTFLDDPRLEERLVMLLAEQWHTRVDVFGAEHGDFFLPDEYEYGFERSVGEEPLRLVAHVAVHDLPYSEIVTADYTVANEMLASIWPLSYPEQSEGWQVATWTDGRPAAGVLVSNGLWWRYITNLSNQNRTRAATLSRLLLCEDILARPVSFDGAPSLADTEGTAEAIRTQDGCLACHSSIEPIAATFFGFWWAAEYSAIEMVSYHPEREELGEELLGVSPAWYGTPVEGLQELGQQVAMDSRFYRCAAETFASALWRREVALEDHARIDALHWTFLDGGALVRPLLRAITDGETYRAGGLSGLATEADERERVVRLLGPDQLAEVLADLTGFTWTQDGFEQLDNDDIGYRTLAGGVDGLGVYRSQQDPGLTWALVAKRAAEGAARFAVEQELVQGEERSLFGEVDLDTSTGDPAFRVEVERLHWRLTGQRVDDTRLDADTELWSQLEALDGAETAWAGLVSTILRDTAFLTY